MSTSPVSRDRSRYPNAERHLSASEEDWLATKTPEDNMTTTKTTTNNKKQKNIRLILSQNVRGLKRVEKKEELFSNLRRRNAFAAMLQETWLTGEETLSAEGFNLICSSLTSEQQRKRGSQGVAIA